MFTENQKVWCAIFGAGIVQRIRQQSGVKYPVIVLFNNGDENVVAYTIDGKYHDDGNVTLFPYPVEIVGADTKNLCEELKHLRDEVKTLREALKTCQNKPQELKPSIDWNHVNEVFQYLAMDADGESYLYTDKPQQGEWQWMSSLRLAVADHFTSFTPGTCDWRGSLVKRPD